VGISYAKDALRVKYEERLGITSFSETVWCPIHVQISTVEQLLGLVPYVTATSLRRYLELQCGLNLDQRSRAHKLKPKR
jgi:hypothetical protein